MAMMMTPSSLLLLLLLLPLFVVVSGGRIVTHPARLALEREIDEIKWGLILGCTIIEESAASFPYEDGLKTLTAILKRFSIKTFIWADKLDKSVTYENRTVNDGSYYVPSCAIRLTMYVKKMENERELLEKDLGLIEDLMRGRRAVKRVRKKMVGFDGSVNLNVTSQLYYDYWNFGVYEVDGFRSLKIPESKSAAAVFENKIEFAAVTKIEVYGVDQAELEKLRRFIGRDHNGLQVSNTTTEYLPLTMLYSVYF